MANENVLSGLMGKRGEITGELEALQARANDLLTALAGLDATIRLFAPDVDLETVGFKRATTYLAATPGHTSRIVLDTLRAAPEPLTSRDLTLLVMKERGLSASDHNLLLTMQRRVLSALRNLQIRGRVQSDKRSGSNLRWRLA
jgi:hypothetical protein